MTLSARTELEPHVRYITADWELRACVRGSLPGGGVSSDAKGVVKDLTVQCHCMPFSLPCSLANASC
jgi:hypothetical protein